jgi:quercetin dioxygenase-like cupin family protein
MTTSGRQGVRIYRAADAPDLAETDFARPPAATEPPNPERARIARDAAIGSQLKVLARDPSGFSLLHVWFKANYPLPRHSHNTDCMYYVISGAAVMGNQTLRAGDSFFVPGDAPYQYVAGPDGVEVLEVRYGAEYFDSKVFGGADRMQTLAAAVDANREQWEAADVSPTLAANAGPVKQ